MQIYDVFLESQICVYLGVYSIPSATISIWLGCAIQNNTIQSLRAWAN